MTEARLVLYGRPVSNYVNAVRMALFEKRLPFSFVHQGAAQSDTLLAMNPMRKIPVLDTGEGHLAETTAILDYLDDCFPDFPLRPDAAIARGRMRQVINILQVYIEVPARSLYAGVFAKGDISPVAAAAVNQTLDRAAEALGQLVSTEEFLLGEQLTQADLFAFQTFVLVDQLTRFLWDRSIIAELGLVAWSARMAARPSSQIILPEFEASLREYLVQHDAPYRSPEQFSHA